ncbi:M24 family metallopeptidase [Haliovirga abyssi]|uniref:Peptidase M24 n=1 Tax=Haliovirga abyssi TaxID=2996794 RepID=A0AAU9DJ78_9FUSO|nr:aminopeptidase P family protein [Haliovirga abyssi]BDU50834.1 peptidase M24 [Haliovirga abyssi]
MKLKELLENEKLDGIFITNMYNLRYFTGFSGTTGVALVTSKNRYFFTDFRYIQQANNQVVPKGFKVVKVERDSLETVKEYIKQDNVKTLGLEDLDMTLSAFSSVKKYFGDIEYKFLGEKLSGIRIVKDEIEIETIKKAISISDIAFTEILKDIKVGISEREIAAKLEYVMKINGAEDKSFETIVASGYRSAMPHGVASDKKIGNNEFITMDFGCYYNGYVSDMTRTVFVGDNLTDKHKEIYNTVLEAQLLAISKVKAGMKAKELDKIARDYITEKGYGENFGHGLGHGIGVEIHEAPGVSTRGEIILEENMTITIEPGIYVEGFGGVRIEDDVIVKKDGCIVMNKSPKDLIILKK